MTKKFIKKLIEEIPDEARLQFECFKRNGKIDHDWMLGYLLGYLSTLKNFVIKGKIGE